MIVSRRLAFGVLCLGILVGCDAQSGGPSAVKQPGSGPTATAPDAPKAPAAPSDRGTKTNDKTSLSL
jgi:hypothetical protein